MKILIIFLVIWGVSWVLQAIGKVTQLPPMGGPVAGGPGLPRRQEEWWVDEEEERDSGRFPEREVGLASNEDDYQGSPSLMDVKAATAHVEGYNAVLNQPVTVSVTENQPVATILGPVGLNSNQLVQAMVWAEILQKPKALRKRK